MSDKYLGSYVSIDCGDPIGVYQGQVTDIDTISQTLTLKDAWKNGLSCNNDVTLLARDIVNLSIIPSPKEDAKLKLKRLQQEATPAGLIRTVSPKGKSKPYQESPQKSSHIAAPLTPTKDRYAKGRMATKDEVCFETDNINMEKDFDFETNLALFDKKTVMGQIKAGKEQGPSPGPGMKSVVSNFRHDENVLESAPPMYRQIHLPCTPVKEFLTDSGLVVPSATAEMRGMLQETMEKHGISIERRSESMARAIAEVALHFVGGPHRLTPKNSHQKPVVVVLCGNHLEAAGAVCAGRHLATLGVRVIVYLHSSTVSQFLVKEIEIFKLTGQIVINNEKRLPTDSVDLIIAALLPPTYTGGGDLTKMSGIIEWANKQRAPTVSIDQPPSSIIQSIKPWLDIKCTMAADLPLTYGDRDGKLYLYSLSTPRQIFQNLGIEYDSPFGSKFVITLHES